MFVLRIDGRCYRAVGGWLLLLDSPEFSALCEETPN